MMAAVDKGHLPGARASHVAHRLLDPIKDGLTALSGGHKHVEIDQYIPVDLYHAAAEMLAYVYWLKGAVR